MVFNKTDDPWEPLLKTPPFPEYGSGHSAFSGAGSEVLTSFFGKKQFSLTLKNVTRKFDSFYDAAYEAGRSRVYGGIHFEFSNIPFINMGMRIAREVLRERKN
jgi:membrane-associated phospholipid phosphatase